MSKDSNTGYEVDEGDLESGIPTPTISSTSIAWSDAAQEQSRKLLKLAVRLRGSSDLGAASRSEEAYKGAKELVDIACILSCCPSLEPELGTLIRTNCIQRIINLAEIWRDAFVSCDI